MVCKRHNDCNIFKPQILVLKKKKKTLKWDYHFGIDGEVSSVFSRLLINGKKKKTLNLLTVTNFITKSQYRISPSCKRLQVIKVINREMRK